MMQYYNSLDLSINGFAQIYTISNNANHLQIRFYSFQIHGYYKLVLMYPILLMHFIARPRKEINKLFNINQ